MSEYDNLKVKEWESCYEVKKWDLDPKFTGTGNSLQFV